MIETFQDYGLEQAVMGLSLSHHDRAVPIPEWWTEEKRARGWKVAGRLAHRQGGHNKFLESCVVQMTINAPRYWWSEFDTYRVGVTKQSESTMHTLEKRMPTVNDFSDNTPLTIIVAFISVWKSYKITERKDISALKAALPEGYLQRRQVTTNYKAIQNVVAQRATHRLKEWAVFCESLRERLSEPGWVFGE